MFYNTVQLGLKPISTKQTITSHKSMTPLKTKHTTTSHKSMKPLKTKKTNGNPVTKM